MLQVVTLEWVLQLVKIASVELTLLRELQFAQIVFRVRTAAPKQAVVVIVMREQSVERRQRLACHAMPRTASLVQIQAAVFAITAEQGRGLIL